MATIDPDLPEGTDHILPGATMTSDTAQVEPSVLSGDEKPAVDWSTTREKLADAGADLKGQATDRVRAYAVSGKDAAVNGLDNFTSLIDDAAQTVDEKVGEQYGAYVRQAGEAIGGFADTLRGKDVDDLFADVREAVKKSPAVAVGAAAAIGFVLMRVVKAGFDAAQATRAEARDETGGLTLPAPRTGDPADMATLGDLVGQLLEDGRGLVRAEVALVKATAAERASAIKLPIVLLIVALVLLQAALTVLIGGLGLGLGHWIGPALGVTAAGAIGVVTAGLLAWLAGRGFAGVIAPLPDFSGDRP